VNDCARQRRSATRNPQALRAFPGIGAKGFPVPRAQMISIVAYAVVRSTAAGKSDYWDQATRLELAILAKDPRKAEAATADALAAMHETWHAETAARNPWLMRETWERRQEPIAWAAAIGKGRATKRRGGIAPILRCTRRSAGRRSTGHHKEVGHGACFRKASR